MNADPAVPAPAAAAYAEMQVERRRGGTRTILQDCIAEETPVALVYNGIPYAVMLATPSELEEFALGFSLSEGIIESAGELQRIATRPRPEGVELALTIPARRAAILAGRERHLAGRSGCGMCGVRTLDQAVRRPPPVGTGVWIHEQALRRALTGIGAWQALNTLTGAVHAAAWATADGGLVLLREDVGRHNALDKLIGAQAAAGTDRSAGFAVITSRASYEMVQKAATAGITLLAAVSAPTALAVRLAQATGLTLVGFAHGADHVVYTHGRRIVPAGETV